MIITIGNVRSRLDGEYSTKVVDDATSCYKTGFQYTSAYRKKRHAPNCPARAFQKRACGCPRAWDGKIHLYQPGSRTVPTGVVKIVADALVAAGTPVTLQMVDGACPLPIARPDYSRRDFGGLTPREYQIKAATAFLAGGLVGQHGVLRMPTASGKTLTLALIAYALGVPTFVLVHGRQLVGQTASELTRFLSPIPVGILMADEYSPGRVVVASVDTVASRLDAEDPVVLDLLGGIRFLAADECFPPSTLIDDGKRIDQVRAGDFVPSFDVAAQEFRPGRVSAVFKKRVLALVRVVFGYGSLVCTPSHRIFTEKGWVEAGNLVEGDRVLKRGRSSYDGWFLSSHVAVCGVEVLGPGDDGSYGGLCPEGFVYDLEVEGFHTYIADGVVVHNCHRIGGGKSTFQLAMDACPAPARLGLSGTPLKKTQDADLLLMSRTGPVLYDLEPSALQDQKFLARAELVVYEIDRPASPELSYRAAMSRLIYGHRARTAFIAARVADLAAEGKKVLVIAGNSIGFVAGLEAAWGEEAASRRLPRATFVTGKDSRRGLGGAPSRVEKAVAELRAGTISVLVSSVLFDEGTDVPDLDVVVLGAPTKSYVKIMQRIGRGLRPKAGKLLVLDFIDTTNGYLVKHFYSRLGTYETEGIFDGVEFTRADLREDLLALAETDDAAALDAELDEDEAAWLAGA